MSARLLVTGSRVWNDWHLTHRALRQAWMNLGAAPDAILVSGAARGADALCEHIWEQSGLPVERHPAHWRRWGKAAGPLRNQQMVDLGADLLLAFPLPESRGTWDCVRRAEAAGIPVTIVPWR